MRDDGLLDDTIIMVNDEPYSIWDRDLCRLNIDFIKRIDVDYFDYLLKVHMSAEDEGRASVALRTTLHHATETLFSLLGAFIQAPDCVYGWLAKCRNEQLRALLIRINKQDSTIFNKFSMKEISWNAISTLVFQNYSDDTNKNSATAMLFAKLWERLVSEYVDDNHISEYNSFKHGFRIRSGEIGFSLSIGFEKELGVAPPPSEMRVIGESKYGTIFLNVEPIGGNKNNLKVRRRTINWSIEKTILQLQLVWMSIVNVTSALKVINQIEGDERKFVKPTEDGDFERPWQYSPSITSFNIGNTIDEGQIIPLTKEELLKLIHEQQCKTAN